MKQIRQMTELDQTPYDALDGTEQPGQICIYNTAGQCVKVLTKTGETKTDQSFGEISDVNTLLEPSIKKGLLRNAIKFEGEYDDYPDFDFQTAHFQIARAQNMFEQLPAKIRTKFNNKPEEFLSFVNNPENKEAIRAMGLSKGLDGKKADGSATPASLEEQAAQSNAGTAEGVTQGAPAT